MACKAPKPMSEAIAVKRVEAHVTEGGSPRSYKTCMYNMRMPVPLKDELAAYAKANYTQMTKVVVEAIVEYLERRGYHRSA